MKNIEPIYFNRTKEENREIADKFGNDDLLYMGYEISMQVQIDPQSNKQKIISINGVKLKQDIYI